MLRKKKVRPKLADDPEVKRVKDAMQSLAAAGTKIAQPPRRREPSKTEVADAIRSAALGRGVDPELVKSVMLVESNFNPLAVSRKGARGLMQILNS